MQHRDSIHSIDSKSIADGSISSNGTTRYPEEEGDESASRINVDLSTSSMEVFGHLLFLSTDVFRKKSDRFALCCMMAHPSFCRDMTCDVENDGLSANISFKWPEVALNPRNFLGKAVSSDHQIFVAFEDEINHRRKLMSNRPSSNFKLQLPFQSEPKTSDDLFNILGSGQTANVVPMSKSKMNLCDLLGKPVFVFKERGNGFNVFTTGSEYIDDEDNTVGNENSAADDDHAERSYAGDNSIVTSSSSKKRKQFKTGVATQDDTEYFSTAEGASRWSPTGEVVLETGKM